MKTYAHIVDGRVFEIIETDQPIESLYHPSLVWVEVEPGSVQIGDLIE